MAWNLADQFNSDLDEKGLFDNLPAQASQLRSDEVLKADVRKLNKTTEGSVVPDSKIAPLEDPRTRSELDSTSRQLKAEQSGNVFDNFEPPKKQTPAPQEQQEPPKELTLGEIIAEGYGIISQVKALKNGRTGANAREVAREKALDEQFIGMVQSRMGDLFEERNLDRNLVERLGTRPGGGYRTAEEIDRVDRIRREGATIKVDGQEITLPKDLDWDQAFEADKMVWAQSVKAAKSKEDDSIKQTQEFFNLAKSWQEAKSKSQENPEDKESQIVFQMLSNRLKAIGGEEYKQLEFGYNQEQYANMMQYYGQKVRPDGQPAEGLKDKTADQVRLDLIKAGAIPVVEGVSGDNGISYDTDDLASKFPGGKPVEGAFVALRNPNAKSADQEFQTHRILNGRLAKLSGPSEPDKAPKKEGSVSEYEPEKTPNKSGKTVYDAARPYFQQSPSSAAGKIADRGMDAALNLGDYAATAIRNRAVAPAAEFLAGTVGEDLDLGRTPNAKPQDRPKQLTPEERLQIIERLTGGPLKSVGKEIIRKKLNK